MARASEPKTVVVTQPSYYYQATPSDTGSATKSVEDRLRDLKRAYDDELISSSEYEQKKAEVLKDM